MMAEEGWYTDPYRRHAARWFSEGVPTGLVRDSGMTSQDPPPTTPYLDQPKLVEPSPSSAEDDLRRAGDEPEDPSTTVDAVWAYFTRSGGGL